MSNDSIEIYGTYFSQTEQSILFSDTGNRKDAVWIGKSLVEEEIPEEIERGTDITITIPEWLAIKNEFV